jgi:hypothetical protein
MKAQLLSVLIMIVSIPAHAASLVWDAQPASGPLTIERGPSPTGPFTMVATVPQGTTTFILTPGAWGHYRVSNAAGPSNTAQYSSDLYSLGVIDRLDALEARVAALEPRQDLTTFVRDLAALDARVDVLETPVVFPPPPAANISAVQNGVDRIDITGLNCLSLRTTGTGLRRTVECVH